MIFTDAFYLQNIISLVLHNIDFMSSFLPLIIPFVALTTISGCTDATTLFSRQSTLEDLDAMPECIPKTSERARPKLKRSPRLDMSSSSMDSGSSFISRCWAFACIHRIYHCISSVFFVFLSVLHWFLMSAESLHDFYFKLLYFCISFCHKSIFLTLNTSCCSVIILLQEAVL